MFIESPGVPLGDRYSPEEEVGSVLSRQSVSVHQRQPGMRAVARCADEYRYPRRHGSVRVFQPPDKVVRRISIDTAVNDFRHGKTPKVMMRVNVRAQGRQKRKRPLFRYPFAFRLGCHRRSIHRPAATQAAPPVARRLSPTGPTASPAWVEQSHRGKSQTSASAVYPRGNLSLASHPAGRPARAIQSVNSCRRATRTGRSPTALPASGSAREFGRTRS